MDNSIKFSPLGAKIYFNLKITDQQIRWEVTNEGNDIPLDQVEDLFKFKVKSTYGTLKEKGTGLGLPLCKKIADKLQMDLGYENKVPGKVTFFLARNLS